MDSDLLAHLDKIRSTELGIERIRRNFCLDSVDVIAWCKTKIENANQIIRKGKNYYVYTENIVITINAHSFTIITAHIDKGSR